MRFALTSLGITWGAFVLTYLTASMQGFDAALHARARGGRPQDRAGLARRGAQEPRRRARRAHGRARERGRRGALGARLDREGLAGFLALVADRARGRAHQAVQGGRRLGRLGLDPQPDPARGPVLLEGRRRARRARRLPRRGGRRAPLRRRPRGRAHAPDRVDHVSRDRGQPGQGRPDGRHERLGRLGGLHPLHHGAARGWSTRRRSSRSRSSPPPARGAGRRFATRASCSACATTFHRTSTPPCLFSTSRRSSRSCASYSWASGSSW